MGLRSRVLLGALLSILFLIGSSGLTLAQDGDVENGKALFGQYCAVCHGYDGQGRVGASLSGWFASIDPQAFVKTTVSDGVAGTMPSFSKSKGGPLTDREINDIATYILSWRKRVEPAPTPTLVPVTPIPQIAGVSGNPSAGAQVFTRECQLCHGEKGQGGIGATLSGAIASAQPAAFLRQTINNGIEGSPMPAFLGALSEDEIEDTVAFILSWDHKPLSVVSAEPAGEDDFNWLLGVLFVVVALVVIVWFVIHYSRPKVLE